MAVESSHRAPTHTQTRTKDLFPQQPGTTRLLQLPNTAARRGNVRDPRQEGKEKRRYLQWKKEKKSEQSCRKKKIKAALAPLRSAARAPHPAVCAPSPPPPPPLPPRLASSTAACWTSLLTSTSSRSQLFGRNVNNTWKRRSRGERRRERGGDATGKNRGGSLHGREGGPHTTMAIFMTIQLQLWRAGFALGFQRHTLKVRREIICLLGIFFFSLHFGNPNGHLNIQQPAKLH